MSVPCQVSLCDIRTHLHIWRIFGPGFIFRALIPNHLIPPLAKHLQDVMLFLFLCEVLLCIHRGIVNIV